MIEAARRAQCLCNADLARALGNRHQHDVHDADAADQQRDADHARHDGGNRAGDLLEGLEEGVGSLHEKVIRVVLLDAMRAAISAVTRCFTFWTASGSFTTKVTEKSGRTCALPNDSAVW